MLQFGVRQTAEVVNQMTCVERVMDYTKLEQEVTTGKLFIFLLIYNLISKYLYFTCALHFNYR